MVSELSAWLAEATVAVTAATMLLLLLRRPLRAAFGAGAAYAAWGLVPAVLLASMLPAAVVPTAPRMAAVVAAGVAGMPTLVTTPAVDYRAWALVFWGLGLLTTWRLLVRQQRSFLRGLGALRRRADGLLESESVAGLPAVIGWRSQIVLPRDFDQRYDNLERQLVLCHEGVHRSRGDLYAGALVAALRCLFWFNPVLHYGAGRFRHDQELACDAAVLRRHPQSRRAYGDALLKTQLADRPLPLGCHWFGSHPLKERIAMLKHPLPHRLRGFTGLVLAALLSLAAGWTVWAAQPAAPSADGLQLQMTLTLNGGGEHVETATMQPGQPRVFTYTRDGQRWELTLTLKPMTEGQVHIAAEILRDGASQGSPRLITKLGTSAAIGIGEQFPDRFEGIQIEMLVTGGESVGQAVELTEGLTGPVPAYPAAQVAAGEGGTVMLRVLVGKDGRPVRSEFEPQGSTVSADSPLVASARETSLKWTFTAQTKDGKPVEAWVAVPVKFEPGKPAAGI